MLYNFVVSTAEQFTKKKTRFDAIVHSEKTDYIHAASGTKATSTSTNQTMLRPYRSRS